MPSSDFVNFIHRASRIPLGQSAKALVWRWRQISPLKIDIFTLSAPNSTNEVSMFKLAIEVCFENHFGLIHAIFLSLGSTKSGYFFLGHPVGNDKKTACWIRTLLLLINVTHKFHHIVYSQNSIKIKTEQCSKQHSNCRQTVEIANFSP